MDSDPSAGASNAGISPKRVLGWTIGIAVAGIAVAATRYGAGAAASFATGAVASYFNFQLLHTVVSGLGPDPRPASRRVAGVFVFRYLALGLIGCATVRVFGVNPVSFCLGLLVSTAAFLLDSMTELIYARA